MKKNVRIIIILFIIFLSVIAYFCADFAIARSKRDLNNLSETKTRTAVQMVIPILNNAVRSSDDITLIDRIQSLAKIDSISSSFITDKDGKVLIHNDVSQINSVKTGSLYKNAIEKRAELIQPSNDPNLFLYSYPLSSGEILFCIVNTQSDKSLFRFESVEYYLISIIFILILAALLLLLSKVFILNPFSNLKKIIIQKANENFEATQAAGMTSSMLNKKKSIISKIFGAAKEFITLNPQEQYKDILDIFRQSNDENIRKINSLSQHNESLSGLITYYCNLQKDAMSVLIALDSLHNVLFALDKTGKILKSDIQTGMNIIEAVSNNDILDIITKANETANAKYEISINDLKISAISIYNGLELSGIIISG